MKIKSIILKSSEHKRKSESIDSKIYKNHKEYNSKYIHLPIIVSILISPILLDILVSKDYLPNLYMSLSTLIIGIMKIIVILVFGILIFRSFLRQEKRYFNDAKNLFACQFFIMACSKALDIYIINLAKGKIQNLENNIEYLLILKIRWIFLTFTLAPTLFFFFYIYSKIWTHRLLEFKKIFPKGPTNELVNKVEKIIEYSFDTGYILIAVTLTIFAPNYTTLKMLLPIFMFPLVLLGAITFHQLYKHSRLPQLNSRMMEYVYIIFLIEQLFRSILITSSLIIYFEAVETVLWYIMGLSFFIRPRYGNISNI